MMIIGLPFTMYMFYTENWGSFAVSEITCTIYSERFCHFWLLINYEYNYMYVYKESECDIQFTLHDI